jgi:hypothetical protein
LWHVVLLIRRSGKLNGRGHAACQVPVARCPFYRLLFEFYPAGG